MNNNLVETHFEFVNQNQIENQNQNHTLHSKLKIYQVWPGNNRFCCSGKLFTGPDWKTLIVTEFIFNIPFILFIIFTAYPSIKIIHFSIFLVALFLFIAVNLSLLLTSFIEPGIIPRDTYFSGSFQHIPETKPFEFQNNTFELPYCDTCNIYRSPRASHCSICDNCVQKFDHHCGWVGCDLGIRNYRFFFLFLIFVTLSIFFVFVVSILHIIILTKEKTFSEAFVKTLASYLLTIYSLPFSMYLSKLTFFHCYLVSKNLTTREYYRNIYKDIQNPFSKGCCKNWIHLLFSKIPPSKIHLKSFANYNDLFYVSELFLNGGYCGNQIEINQIQEEMSKIQNQLQNPNEEINENDDPKTNLLDKN
ncbi:s-acyltransferase [Anaeramoeba ignava]|uniref:Palmitoyltransferase n=1 Tax=Anaeramoeba ignava TaxID=1746090 RepID=A0A9Q0RI69_ANAIG|nr:s-acyltransferase [Anaeramoeba ignava]